MENDGRHEWVVDQSCITQTLRYPTMVDHGQPGGWDGVLLRPPSRGRRTSGNTSKVGSAAPGHGRDGCRGQLIGEEPRVCGRMEEFSPDRKDSNKGVAADNFLPPAGLENGRCN